MSNTSHVPSNTEQGEHGEGSVCLCMKRPAKVSGEGNMRAEPEGRTCPRYSVSFSSGSTVFTSFFLDWSHPLGVAVMTPEPLLTAFHNTGLFVQFFD